MQVTGIDLEKFRQLAKYMLHGASPLQAGIAAGFSETRVLELLQDDIFKKVQEEERNNLLTDLVDIDQMYTRIEKQALSQLEKVARINMDPDLNMRLAMLANRATRRSGLHTNRPIDAGKVDGARITVRFSQSFVQQVQGGTLQQTRDITVESNELNQANPTEVKDLMNIRSFRNNEMTGPSPDAEIRSLADFLS